MTQNFELRVPATTANLGPGYGVVGLALDLWFDFRVTVHAGHGEFSIERPDSAAEKASDPRHDSFARGLRAAADRFDIKVPDGLRVVIRGDAPRRCGLGSNTAEHVAGIQAACRFAKSPPTVDERLDLLVAVGGDPAHGAAALRGGLAFAVPVQSPTGDARYRCLGGRISKVWWLAITAPDVAIGTADVHRVVPATLPNAVLQRSSGRLVGLLHALEIGDEALLGGCLLDEVHVPFRMQLAPGMTQALDAARESGAAGATISGHGPAMLAFAVDSAGAERAGAAMAAAFESAGVPSRTLVVRPVALP